MLINKVAKWKQALRVVKVSRNNHLKWFFFHPLLRIQSISHKVKIVPQRDGILGTRSHYLKLIFELVNCSRKLMANCGISPSRCVIKFLILSECLKTCSQSLLFHLVRKLTQAATLHASQKMPFHDPFSSVFLPSSPSLCPLRINF